MRNHNKLMLSLGNRIKAAREETGITQEELAEHVGISRAAVARYESGEIEPKIKNLVAIAMRLNVTTDFLLGIECKQKEPLTKDLSDEAKKALEVFISEVKKNKEKEN